MLILLNLFFIIFLSMVLYMLYRDEHELLISNRHHARMEEYWDGKDRRKFTRFKKALDVIYKISKKPNHNKGRTLDISEGGVKLRLDEKHAPGTIMNMSISVPGLPEEVALEGRVVWCEETKEGADDQKRFFCHGVEFLTTGEPSGKNLKDYIRSISSIS